MAKYDAQGREIPDPTPIDVPLNWKRPQPLNEIIKQLIRTEMSRQAQESGHETFEEADDFEVDDDPIPLSEHELDDDQQQASFQAFAEALEVVQQKLKPEAPSPSLHAKPTEPKGDDLKAE